MWVHPAGTRRRLQALAADGWSTAQLATELGVTGAAITHLRTRRQDRILAATAANVTTLYERLWWRTPPGGSTTRSERYAERQGWAPAWRWEGVDLDDPDAVPLPDQPILDHIAISEARAGRPVSLTREERRQVEELLEERGYSAAAIAQLTGQSERSVERHRCVRRSAA